MGFDNVIAIAGACSREIFFTRHNSAYSFLSAILFGAANLILILMERFPFPPFIAVQRFLAYTAGKMVTHKTDLSPFFITIQVSLQAFLICSIVSLFYASALLYNEVDYAMWNIKKNLLLIIGKKVFNLLIINLQDVVLHVIGTFSYCTW